MVNRRWIPTVDPNFAPSGSIRGRNLEAACDPRDGSEVGQHGIQKKHERYMKNEIWTSLYICTSFFVVNDPSRDFTVCGLLSLPRRMLDEVKGDEDSRAIPGETD